MWVWCGGEAVQGRDLSCYRHSGRAAADRGGVRKYDTELAPPTRLETRTKESNNGASIWVANPDAE